MNPSLSHVYPSQTARQRSAVPQVTFLLSFAIVLLFALMLLTPAVLAVATIRKKEHAVTRTAPAARSPQPAFPGFYPAAATDPDRYSIGSLPAGANSELDVTAIALAARADQARSIAARAQNQLHQALAAANSVHGDEASLWAQVAAAKSRAQLAQRLAEQAQAAALVAASKAAADRALNAVNRSQLASHIAEQEAFELDAVRTAHARNLTRARHTALTPLLNRRQVHPDSDAA